jgi:hypothetical protein
MNVRRLAVQVLLALAFVLALPFLASAAGNPHRR